MLLSGNQAIARGAWEAGCAFGVGYPGTPSTEILENLRNYDKVMTEWSVNEKVALEVGLGAAFAGARTLVTMKHVGVNVAADPLFTAAYTGIRGGLVIVTADDPEMHSSQNEQDNRHYARSAKLPMLEPSDPDEARLFTKLAFELSEKWDTPVFLRSTTRLSHSCGVVMGEERKEAPVTGFKKDLKKYVMIPAFARMRHKVVEERMETMSRESDSLQINRVEAGNGTRGFITSGVPYQYVREVFPDAPILKIGMAYPIPRRMIRDFCSNLDEVVIVEELDPFYEEQIRAMGIEVKGKELLPITGEYSPELLAELLGGKKPVAERDSMSVPPRPPQLCAGCPHHTVFSLLSKRDRIVSGDIGCYTLGVLPPYSSIDTCVDMGASMTVAQGMSAVGEKPPVAIIGDSTFAHSGITGLINAAYNKRKGLTIVLDNGTTAMTGMQPNPFSGKTISGEDTVRIDYALLAKACGMPDDCVKIVNAYSPAEVEETLDELLAKDALTLMVVMGPCVINRRKMKKEAKA